MLVGKNGWGVNQGNQVNQVYQVNQVFHKTSLKKDCFLSSQDKNVVSNPMLSPNEGGGSEHYQLDLITLKTHHKKFQLNWSRNG